MMDLDLLHRGELYSALTALFWAMAVILFRRSGEKVPPVALNLFKSTLGWILVALTMLAVGIPFLPEGTTPRDVWVLLLSGVLGIAVADSLFFAALNRLGAGRIAIVDCLYSPGVLVLSALFLREPCSHWLLLGVALMTMAILIGAWEPGGEGSDQDRRELKLGVLLGVLGILGIAASIVMAKPVLNRVDPWWATWVRLSGGLVCLWPQGLQARHRPSSLGVFRPSAVWSVMIPASLLGNYLALILWTLGMKLAPTNVASLLNQLSNVFIMLLAWLVLREQLRVRQWIGIALGIAAAALAVS